MSTNHLTDSQIHDRASGYARRHRVDYAEAVRNVVAFAEASGEVQPASFSQGGGRSDAQVDARARAYAAEHHKSYAEALQHVTSFADVADFSELTRQRADLSDSQIDKHARAYMGRHGVGYAEALQHVVSFAEASGDVQPASFSQGGDRSDAQIDARARAYAAEHHKSYADALQHVTSFADVAEFSELPGQRASLSDTQIDKAARACMGQYGMDYAEALQHVVSFAETGDASPGGADAGGASMSFAAPSAAAAAPAVAPGHAVHTPGIAPRTDDELHAAVQAYAALHGVDYLHAMRAVLAEREDLAPDAGLQSDLPDGVSEQDRRLDRAALAYVRAMGVSYSEALSEVLLHSESDFAEGVGSASDAVTALQGQYIEIFRAGTHTDSAGRKSTFTAQDVKAIAASYDPARGAAPLTLGHPDTNGPGYGRVKALRATDDGRLLMLADQIDPAFADSVKAGRYRKRSASFYPPSAPGNPARGQWYLRHVGWLGAQPPAVAGLADVKFSTAAQDGALCFSDFS